MDGDGLSRAVLAVAVMAAGAGGSVVRYVVTDWWTTRRPHRPRDGVAVVNVVGAFWLGLLSAVEGPWALVVGTGLLGGFTTFSTWLVEAGRAGPYAVVRDVVLHMALGLPAALLGMAAARMI